MIFFPERLGDFFCPEMFCDFFCHKRLGELNGLSKVTTNYALNTTNNALIS